MYLECIKITQQPKSQQSKYGHCCSPLICHFGPIISFSFDRYLPEQSSDLKNQNSLLMHEKSCTLCWKRGLIKVTSAKSLRCRVLPHHRLPVTCHPRCSTFCFRHSLPSHNRHYNILPSKNWAIFTILLLLFVYLKLLNFIWLLGRGDLFVKEFRLIVLDKAKAERPSVGKAGRNLQGVVFLTLLNTTHYLCAMLFIKIYLQIISKMIHANRCFSVPWPKLWLLPGLTRGGWSPPYMPPTLTSIQHTHLAFTTTHWTKALMSAPAPPPDTVAPAGHMCNPNKDLYSLSHTLESTDYPFF